jgi:hypothetical protein
MGKETRIRNFRFLFSMGLDPRENYSNFLKMISLSGKPVNRTTGSEIFYADFPLTQEMPGTKIVVIMRQIDDQKINWQWWWPSLQTVEVSPLH